ncbi:MAG: hypothetical protein J7M06_01420, partial [Proteobacteria bacterium]|nr:hypothetical protein [Pseudomonadota bacterium]
GKLRALMEESGYDEDSESKVKVIRNIIAYKPSTAPEGNKALLDKIRKWVDLFLDFSDKNIESLTLLKTGIMEAEDIAAVASIVKTMIDLHQKICENDQNSYLQLLEEIVISDHDNISLSYRLNRLINQIHQDVLKNVFGVFTGWKKFVGEINTVSNKAVGITADDEGNIEHFPANKVNIIDYSNDFERGNAVVARSIVEAYLSTNIHLRDNCYLDCISHTNKAWFFADLGLHGANIFVDLDPTQRLITVSYAEGDVEDGNMVRLRFLIAALEKLGFAVERTEIAFKATLDKQNVGLLSADELVNRAIWTIQVFASVADFDLEIEDGGISERGLRYHKERLSSSGTGFPLYKISKGARELKKMSRSLDELNRDIIISILNPELLRVELKPIPDTELGGKAIAAYFNRPVNKGITTGKFITHKSNPLALNPQYSEPDPILCLEQFTDKEYLEGISTIVNILDKSVGSKYAGTHDDKRVTVSLADILGGKIAFYSLRDKDTNKAINAFAVGGECLRKVSLNDNVIRDPEQVRSLLIENGYNLEPSDQNAEWPVPRASNARGITVPAIMSCPGIATGFLRKNRPGDVPTNFNSAIFSDNILTPSEVGRLREAFGFITINDSTLSHAQLTARTFGKPGVIIQDATWTLNDTYFTLNLPLDEQNLVIKEGQIVTVDAMRGMVNIVGASFTPSEDCRDLIQNIFTLLVQINKGANLRESFSKLEDVIVTTEDVEILKFIIQELFITNTVSQNTYKLEILTLILDNCREILQSQLVEYLKEVVIDYHRREQYDIEMAKQKLVITEYVNEALHVMNRIYNQLQMPKEMEYLLCQRAGLCALDYSSDMEEIQGLYNKKVNEFKMNAINEINRIENKGDDLSSRDLGKAIRIIEGISLLPSYDTVIEKELKKIENKVGEKAKAFKIRFKDSEHKFIVELKDTGSVISPYVGNKAAFLGELMETSLERNVLPGFILTSIGVRKIIEENRDKIEQINEICKSSTSDKALSIKKVLDIASGLAYPDDIKGKIIKEYHALERSVTTEEKVQEFHRLAGMVNLDRKKLDAATSALRGSKDFYTVPLGKSIPLMGLDVRDEELILDMYRKQGGVFVVVRSSSILEDTHEEMMAGRFKSYPYIRGAQLLLEHILRCLAYYWVEIKEVNDEQPVFIHQQMEADVSMVINSINMVEEKWDEVIINSARGAGAGLVSAMVDSDLYFVDANHFSVKRVINSIKKTKCIFDEKIGYGVKNVSIDDKDEQVTPSLSEEEASGIAKLARDIHKYFHYPVDIEAVKNNNKVYVVQVRPIVLPSTVSDDNEERKVR